jgi:hypothetical protein
VTIQDPGGPGPEVFNVVLSQAREVRSTPFGAVGTVFSGQGIEMVWVSKLAVRCGTMMVMSASPDWLSRYRDGHRDQVWHELRQLGRAVHEPDLAAQAQRVCDEMARRARRNIEVIVGRLTEQGYRFHANDDEQGPVTPYYPPGPESSQMADWLQGRFGAVPMTLLSWVRIVGDVWLVGTHPQWPDSASADPLVIQVEGSQHPDSPIREYFER